MKKVYVVIGGGKKPGGFCVPNLGPDKVTKKPGEQFPAEWMDEVTLKRLIKDKHMKYAEESSDEPEAPKATEAPEAPKATEANAGLEKLCIYEEADLSGLKRGELDDIVKDICEQAGVDVPELANIDEVKAFLTQGESE